MRSTFLTTGRAIALCTLLTATAFLSATAPSFALSVNDHNPPTATASHAQITSDITDLSGLDLTDFTTNQAAGRVFGNGVWTNPDTSCWSCLDSAGTAAAVLYVQNPRTYSTMLRTAAQTFNTLIATEQQPDGSFGTSANTANVPISTEFLVVEFGTTFLELRHTLDSRLQASWISAITRAADYLINSGQTTWYANGNIQLRLTEDMWLAWQITGQARFDTAYESEWTFAMSPPKASWPGYGLQVTQAPAKADGSDGSGYLAEAGPLPSTPGFDPEYTMTQLDTATSMWVLSRDPRYLKLMNMLFNQLQPRINSVWTFDATGGSRYSIVLPFYNVAAEVLVNDGDRPDLALGATVQLWRLECEFTNTVDFNNPNYYKGVSGWVSMVLLDAQWPNGIMSPAAPAVAGTTSVTTATLVSASTPRVTITPSAPSSSTTSLAVTVSGAAPGSSVNVTVSPTPAAPAQSARRSGSAGSRSSSGRVGMSHRLQLHVRVHHPRFQSAKRWIRFAVRLTIRDPGHHIRTIARRLEVSAA